MSTEPNENKAKDLHTLSMTHVNNGKGAASAPTKEMERGRQWWSAVGVAPAAGGSEHRFLSTENCSVSSSDSSSSHVDAVSATTTAENCLEECAFVACQTKASSDWHDDFCITDDELEYEDELELSAGCSATTTAASTSAATPAHEYGLPTFGLREREQQNEQLLMEGILGLGHFSIA